MSTRSFLILLLTIALVYQQAGATTPILGQVTVKGQAKINGVATPSGAGATVFSGDRVTTETNTVVELILTGGSKVLVPESSAVVLSNDASQILVNLNQGALAVLSKSSAPTIIEANGARIKPAANTAVMLEIAVRENSLKVLAWRGSAIVETADKSLEVKEGSELDATMAPPIPQVPQGAGTAAHSRLLTWVFIAAVGGGLTGLGLGINAITRPNPAECKVGSPSGTITCP